jgi:predicted Zn-dependent protease with MMP-like domain
VGERQTVFSQRAARQAHYTALRKRVSPRASPRAFEEIVAEAIDILPPFILDRMDNVAVVVREWPRASADGEVEDLLGLYEGINQLDRAQGYHLAVPDQITIFRQPILEHTAGKGRAAVVREVRDTIVHEVAHHFGFDDEELEWLEQERSRDRR